LALSGRQRACSSRRLMSKRFVDVLKTSTAPAGRNALPYHGVVLAARAVIGSAALALLALTVVHFLKRDLDPSRTMISRYALGPYGWLMALCFAAWAAASALLFVALAAGPSSSLDRVGQILLLAASIGLTMAARFPMDPVGTPHREMSFSGRMHGIAFLVGVPALVLAASILSLAASSGS